IYYLHFTTIAHSEENMAATRASMRLAMRKGTTDEAKIEKPPPRKVRQTIIKPRRRRLPKKPVYSLDRFVNMPLDILTEIASYLFPIDITTLSRSSKLFRDILMRRSSRHIWINAMRNIEMLPRCPSDMSEPAYLALLFSRYCTVCGRVIVYHLNAELRMRLCASCRKTQLIVLDTLPSELKGLVHTIRIYPKVPRVWGCWPGGRVVPTYYTTTEANEINDKLTELQQAGDQIALRAWKNERIEVVRSRSKEADAVHRFLDAWTLLPKAQR
ncbi:unnamed protein product, partial [Rhizoctonia solani]